MNAPRLVAALAAALLATAACSSTPQRPVASSVPTSAAAPATSAPATTAAVPTLGLPTRLDRDGWYHAGPYSASDVTAVEPGIYATGGPAGGSHCTISLTGPDGEPAAGSGFVMGPMTIEMPRGAMLSTSGCQPWEWQKVG